MEKKVLKAITKFDERTDLVNNHTILKGNNGVVMVDDLALMVVKGEIYSIYSYIDGVLMVVKIGDKIKKEFKKEFEKESEKEWAPLYVVNNNIDFNNNNFNNNYWVDEVGAVEVI